MLTAKYAALIHTEQIKIGYMIPDNSDYEHKKNDKCEEQEPTH